jgi:hypothetical protein
MQAIKTLLSQYNSPVQDKSIQIIREYILSTYTSACQVSKSNGNYVLTLDSAELATTIKLDIQNLIKNCQLETAPKIRVQF